jgi:hypothetical protein
MRRFPSRRRAGLDMPVRRVASLHARNLDRLLVRSKLAKSLKPGRVVSQIHQHAVGRIELDEVGKNRLRSLLA